MRFSESPNVTRDSLLLLTLQYLEFIDLIIGIIQFLTWLVSEWHLWVPLKVWSWKAETERSESHWLISRRLTSTSKERNPSNLLEKIRGKYLYIILKPFLLMLKTLLWYSFGYRCYLLKCRKRIDWYLGGSHRHQKKEIPVICWKKTGVNICT